MAFTLPSFQTAEEALRAQGFSPLGDSGAWSNGERRISPSQVADFSPAPWDVLNQAGYVQSFTDPARTNWMNQNYGQNFSDYDDYLKWIYGVGEAADFTIDGRNERVF